MIPDGVMDSTMHRSGREGYTLFEPFGVMAACLNCNVSIVRTDEVLVYQVYETWYFLEFVVSECWHVFAEQCLVTVVIGTSPVLSWV